MHKDKRVLVIGGAGSIGSALVAKLVEHNKVFVLDNNESGLFEVLESHNKKKWCHGRVGDIRNKETIHDVFSDFKPQVVYHAAAYKHVPLMQTSNREAVEVNVLGTLNILEEAKKWECVENFVFISTDKAVNAESIMGASKKLCEVLVKQQGQGFIVVRFGNVWNTRGSLATIWDKQMKNGKNLTVTHEDMKRYMMTMAEAVDLVACAHEVSRGGEIVVLDMGEPVKIMDLAEDMLKGTALGIDIIGVREGEVIEERLFTEDEAKRVRRINKFFVIK